MHLNDIHADTYIYYESSINEFEANISNLQPLSLKFFYDHARSLQFVSHASFLYCFGGGVLESRCRPYFLRLIEYSLTRSYFVAAKTSVFSTKIWGFCGKWAFFLKNYPFSDVTKTICSFSIFF